MKIKILNKPAEDLISPSTGTIPMMYKSKVAVIIGDKEVPLEREYDILGEMIVNENSLREELKEKGLL